MVKDGAVLCDDGTVVAAGKQKDVLKHPLYKKNKRKTKTLDCKGQVVTPGFVDSHTHPAFIHPRLTDFELRTAGASYQEIAAAGGGIVSSVKGVRKASKGELSGQVKAALDSMLRHGTTTVEAKSGYGLSLAAEIKSLQAVRDAAKRWPGTVRSTLLGAHVVPKEYKTRRAAYLRLVTEKMMPEADRLELLDFVDVYCDEGAFTLAEAAKIFEAADAMGIYARAHVGQFSPCSLDGLLYDGPASLDHLDCLDTAALRKIARVSTVATLVPGANYFLGHKKYPDARKMLSLGLPLALATDYNPGTSPTANMQFILSLACTQMKLSPAETISAATLNGAHALMLEERKGSIEPGKDADMAVFGVKDYREIAYWFGGNLCEQVVVGGRLID